MNKTAWQLENEALENAFARRLLVEYNIKEVTTQRQAKNSTLESLNFLYQQEKDGSKW